jgi:hypothetical protein
MMRFQSGPVRAADPPVARGYKVDISCGEHIGRISSEWCWRPDDERYTPH